MKSHKFEQRVAPISSVCGPATRSRVEPLTLRRVIQEAVRLGVTPDGAFRGLGYARQDLETHGLRLSLEETGTALARLLCLIERPPLGLELGARATVSAWGMAGLALMLSSDSRALIDLAVTHQRRAGRLVGLSCDSTATTVCLIAEPVFTERRLGSFLLDETFASFTQICRQVVGTHFNPRQVEFVVDRPRHGAAYESFFRCPVHFGREQNRLHFPAQPYVVPSGDAVLLAEASECLSHAADSADDERSALELAVLQCIRRTLAKPDSLAEIAASLHLTERTLRRRLDGLGLSYAGMLDEQRKVRALELIVQSSRPLPEVARECGFGDDRTLARAVKRWTGHTPVKLRRQA